MSAPERYGPWRPTRAEVDVDAIAANVAALRAASGVDVCAVVKADGYGHGAVRAARAALTGGAGWLAVALVEEGAELRAAGVDAPVLLLSEPPVAAIDALMDLRLTPTVYRAPFVDALDAAARARATTLAVHVKLDTGMTRVGAAEPAWPDLLARLAAAGALDVEGVQTHLACAEDVAAPSNAEQKAVFARGLEAVAAAGFAPRIVHAGNTAVALAHPDARFTMVRTGIGVYGASPGGDVDVRAAGLVPALRLVSEVSFARRIAAGTAVSYGHRWRAPVDGWLATVPIGYADGVPRVVTGRAEVLVGGRRRPLVGTVTMDQVLVWCGDDEVAVGDEVVLVGAQGDARVRVEEVAAWADTIPYEIVTRLGPRVPRVTTGAG